MPPAAGISAARHSRVWGSVASSKALVSVRPAIESISILTPLISMSCGRS